MNNTILDKVFKNYDIRGIADTEITEELAYFVGNALAQRNKLKTCIVGRDARKTSPQLSTAVIKGLVDAGVTVTDIGLCSTPLIKWVVGETGMDAGIMVSASHNPPEYNGFKIFQQHGLALGRFNGLDELKTYQKPHTATGGSVEEKSYMDVFLKQALKTLSESDAEVFIDPSGGVGAPEIKRLMELGSFNFTLYNAEIDPSFSLHSPNPLDPEAMVAAQEYCGMNKCLGAVLDADADRVIFVDEEGQVVPGDLFGAWLAKKQGYTRAASTVRDSRALKHEIMEQNGTYMLSPVGHAFVQNLLYDNDLELGIEKSGHIFFKESYFAENHILIILLALKHLKGKRLADEMKQYRETYLCSEEHNYRVNNKEEVLSAAKTLYAQEKDVEIITIDGVLAEGTDWWVSVRASNTEPLMRITWEATTQEHYNKLKRELEAFIKPFVAE